jgi:NAD+ synthase (glutamine-hydrolysing)
MRLALAQINVSVGDLEGNSHLILRTSREAQAQGADMVCFPELALSGYPPEDLLLKRDFLERCMDHLHALAREIDDIIVILGTPYLDDDLFNAAAVIHKGEILAVYHKHFLPNYGVFDEYRYFASGREGLVLKIGGLRVGVTVCEDIWYPGGPMEAEVTYGGAELVVNLSSSPYQRGKHFDRERLLKSRTSDAMAILAYVNCVGGQDELVFDGGSMILHPLEEEFMAAPRFVEDLMFYDVNTTGLWGRRMMYPLQRYLRQGNLHIPMRVLEIEAPDRSSAPALPGIEKKAAPDLKSEDEILEALLLGLKDYVRKNRFQHVLIGLSGGIDSALTAAIATMALGPSNVHCVFMPSRYSAEVSYRGAEMLAASLGVSLDKYAIDEIFESYVKDAQASLEGPSGGLAAENLQARIRGDILMSISNSRGWLVLATGNKSELSMGYCTLYGDMAGGYAVLKDLLKRDVYGLSRYINEREGREVIPQIILEREPSAELRENQRDVDSLPPYEVLDPILEDYIENGLTIEEMAAKGYSPELVRGIIYQVDTNEYKRRQAPVGIKITSRAFGRDWRLPISKFEQR